LCPARRRGAEAPRRRAEPCSLAAGNSWPRATPGIAILVFAIEIQYRDGTSVAHGSFGGGRRPPFVLLAGEKLVKIDTRQGDSLDGCKFFTNTGRSSQWYGGLGGTSIEFLASAQDPIIDIKRRGGHCSRMTGIVGVSGLVRGGLHVTGASDQTQRCACSIM